jgi:hypothetical protein
MELFRLSTYKYLIRTSIYLNSKEKTIQMQKKLQKKWKIIACLLKKAYICIGLGLRLKGLSVYRQPFFNAFN